MTTDEMLKRTKQFAVNSGHLILSLEMNAANRTYGNQLTRSAASAGQITGRHEEQNPTLIL